MLTVCEADSSRPLMVLDPVMFSDAVRVATAVVPVNVGLEVSATVPVAAGKVTVLAPATAGATRST